MYQLLIADDESITRKGIQSLLDLSKIGIYKILEAQDGKEVLDVVEENCPDIILLDINMPDIDGLTVADIIKQKYPELYIIMLTGYDYFEYMQKAIRAKVDDYILKPVTKEDIHHILKNACMQLDKRKKEKQILQLLPEHNVVINEQYQQIKEYIDKFLYHKELSLQHMAMTTGYTSNYLSILMKQIYAMPFQEYINQKRMEKAKILLLSSADLKNQEIADMIGIEDVNYFITKFKKYEGVTPKQFQRGKQK